MTSYSAELNVSSDSFKEAINWALKGYSPKEDNEYILFEIDTKNTVLDISSVSTQYYFKDNVRIESFEYHENDSDEYRSKKDSTIKFAVDGSVLSKVSGVLPKGKILNIKEVIKNKEHVLTIKTSGYKFDLALLENKRPPGSPKITPLGESPAYELINTLKPLTRIADISAASAAPALAAINFKLVDDDSDSCIKLMSTDQYVLSEMVVPFEKSDSADEENDDGETLLSRNQEFLIHAADMALITKENPEPGTVVEIGVVLDRQGKNKEKVAFTFNNGKSACVSNVDTEPLNYQNFTLKRDEKHVVVKTKEFAEAVRIAGMMSWDSDDVFITLSENELSVTNSKSSATVQVSYDEDLTDTEELDTDEPITVHFLSSVATKAINPVFTEKLKLSFITPRQFFRITPILDSGKEQDGVLIMFTPVIKRNNN